MFSLILATIGRYKEVDNFLESLLNQSYKDFEVIIIDQNKNNDLKILAKKYQDNFPIQYIKQSKPGLSSARNTGIKNAKSKYIAFPDDDCLYPINLLQGVNNIFQKENHDFISIMCRDTIDNNQLSYTPLDKKTKITTKNVFNAVTSIGLFMKNPSKKIYFDTKLGAGTELYSCEEIDFVFRLLKDIKYKGMYIPDIYVQHPALPSNSLKKIYNNSKGHGAFAKKHYKVNCNFFFYNVILLIFIKPFAGLVLSILKINTHDIKKYYFILMGRIYGFFRS